MTYDDELVARIHEQLEGYATPGDDGVYPLIPAVKLYRLVTGHGLRESVDWVRAHPECRAVDMVALRAATLARRTVEAAPRALESLRGLVEALNDRGDTNAAYCSFCENTAPKAGPIKHEESCVIDRARRLIDEIEAES